MQGADKGLLLLAGRPLVMHVHEALRTQVGTVIVSANRHAADYAAALALPVVADRWDDYRGPLAGICAGFDATRSDWLLAVPADMPGLPSNLLAQLRAQCSGAAAYAVLGGDAVYPLCLLHRRLHADLRASLERGDYAVRHWLGRHAAAAVPIEGWHGEAPSLNTPEALQAAERRWRARGDQGAR